MIILLYQSYQFTEQVKLSRPTSLLFFSQKKEMGKLKGPHRNI